LSQCEMPLTFGLGTSADPVTIEISWPGGAVQKVTGLAVDKLHTVQQSPQ
jgi:enediyne biosynthesis protein E4